MSTVTKIEHRYKIAAWIAIGIILALCNVYTLAIFSEDGRIDGLRRQYIWAFDIWLLVLGLALLLNGRLKHVLAKIVFLSLIVGCIELASLLAYKIVFKRWHFDDGFTGTIFEPHPWLVGVPKAGASLSRDGKLIRHNSFGFRGKEFMLTQQGSSHRIVTIGGSSTYGVGVSEGQTWPEYLERNLGPGYEVVNYGVPGYSSAEHVIQTALQLSDLQADYVIYYVGWNDARSSHVKNLKSDYSGFHGRSQYGNLRLPPVWSGPNLATPRMLVHILQRAGWIHRTLLDEMKLVGEIKDGIDERALALYRRNLSLLATMAKELGVVPIFVPQVLNENRLHGKTPYGWLPYVRDRDLPRIMKIYNRQMAAVAAKRGVAYISEVLSVSWEDPDFIDNGHFSDRGNRRFAEVVAQHMREHILGP